ncbi:MAG: ArnT family glycosyltransferase, partial [Candidatus Odinarchaeota archaeon]
MTEATARLPYLFAGTITVAIFYKITKELFGTFAGHIAAALASVTGQLIAFSRHVQFFGLFLLFSLLAAYYSIKFNKSSALKDSGFAAFFFGLTLLSHHVAIFMGIPLIYLISKKLYDNSLEIKDLIIPVTILALVTLPFFIPWMLASYYLPEFVPPGEGYASTSQRAGLSLYFNLSMFGNWLRYSPGFFYFVLIFGVLISLWHRSWKVSFFGMWFLSYFIPLTFLITSKTSYTFISLLPPLIILAGFGIKKAYLIIINKIRRANKLSSINILTVGTGICFLSLSAWNCYVTFLQYDLNPTSVPLIYNSSYKNEMDIPYGATYGRKIGYKAAGWFVRHNSLETDVIFGDDSFKVAYYCDRLIQGNFESREDFEEIKRDVPKNLFILFPSTLINEYPEIWDFATKKYNLVAIVTSRGQP